MMLIAAYHSSTAQGCSDAGVCTMGTMRSATHDRDTSAYASVTLTPSYGAGEQGVAIVQVLPEVEWRVAHLVTLRASLPLMYTSGSLGTNSGIGDAVFSVSRTFQLSDDVGMGLTLGTRLPTGTTNAVYTATASLPMPYQTGLGTTDLVVGVSSTFDRWSVALGYQRVLANNNLNTYVDQGLDYFTSKDYQRGDDAILRIGRAIPIADIDLVPSVLAIYRVQQDRVMGERVEGSDGLTLNLALAASASIADRMNLRFDVAAPVIVRKVRADGLTRALVVSLSLAYEL
jgi:hypothetical protein